MINRRDWLRSNAALLGSLMLPLSDLGAKNTTVNPIFNAADPMLRLGQNENPYGPSPMAVKAMAEEIAKGNRYAGPLLDELRGAIAQLHGVTKDNVLLGAGSSEILGLATQMASTNGKGQLVAANPTFRIWLNPAERFGLEVVWVPLDAKMSHDLERMDSAVNDKTRMIYVCNPNNPTGTVLPDGDLRDFVKKNASRTMVVLDEAYTEYADCPSLIDMIQQFPNLIVAKTFSKIHSMAGSRVGYAIAHADTVKTLSKFQPWANAGVSNVTAAGALASLKDKEFQLKSKKLNEKTMTFTEGVLKQKGFIFIPSKTNFIFFDVNHLKIDFAEEMKKRNIWVRNWEADNRKFARVSMGTIEEMQVFAEVFLKMV